ncbi:MAG: hypothetical protein NC099_03570 [Corallococcus sp.]|nr:hypothetical protein [Bacillota bacterium]MCM1533713.1 hypothetical protein [Corallococcus sp.]
MGFISFNLNYYKNKIEYYENNVLTKSDIYEAKQLLKMIDDLIDEKYYELYNALQKDSAIVDRLKTVVKASGEEPFAVMASGGSIQRLNNDKTELKKYLDDLTARAETYTNYPNNDFFEEIKRFCNSIEYDANRSYIFLLRDTLLPYVFFKNKYAENIYPYLISRSFFNMLYKNKNVDDVVRAVIFEALEKGYDDFEKYMRYCKKEISNKLTSFPKLATIVKNLLSQIKSEKNYSYRDGLLRYLSSALVCVRRTDRI